MKFLKLIVILDILVSLEGEPYLVFYLNVRDRSLGSRVLAIVV